MAHISVVTPVYKAEGCIMELYQRLTDSLSAISDDYEIIMVEDCGGDRSWDIIKELSAKDKKVKGIKFSRNFGQHNALTAGLDYTNGDWVVVMDCDLQDQPEEIIKLYNKAKEGYDVVFGRRTLRKDGFTKKATSNLYKVIHDYLKGSETDFTIANFSISSRNVIENFRKMREHNRSFGQFIFWLGFKIGKIDIEHAKRAEGKSSYTFLKLLRLGADTIVAYTNRPLRLSIYLGILMAIFSFLFGIYLIIKHYLLNITVPGWTSVMVSIYFIGGLLFMNLGILGLYIGKIFDETKNRPLYIIKDKTNLKD